MYKLSREEVRKLYSILEEIENLYPRVSGITKGAYDHKAALDLLKEVEEEINYNKESLCLQLSPEEVDRILDVGCQPICPLCGSELKHVKYEFCGGEGISYFRGYTAYCKECRELREVRSDNPLGFIALGVMKGYDNKKISFEVIHESGGKSILEVSHDLSPVVLEFYSKLVTILEIIVVDHKLICIRSFI
ncbi:MAG: hypothetical protein R6U44_07810 [Archaeoglobaceae archaeon]